MDEKKRFRPEVPAVFLAGALIGAALFILIYGVNILDPSYDGWLLNNQGDLTQHYIGWEFFRKTKWHFPIGLTDGLLAGQPLSVMFTDSVPLFAVFFKLLSPLLHDTFQYFGFWGLFCFFMQGGLSASLLRKLTKKPVYSIIGSIIYVICPAILQRMYGHEALGGQWVITLALLLWICQDRAWKFRASPVILWGITGVIAVSVHMYYVPMTCLILAGCCLTDMLVSRKYLRPLLCVLANISGALLNMFLLGAFYGGGSKAASGLGIFSANYNTFFNGAGISQYMQPLNWFDGQYEGFAYLGLGILVGGAVCLILVPVLAEQNGGISSFRKCSKRMLTGAAIAGFLVLLSLVIAASPKGTLNGRVLYEIPLSDRMRQTLSIFRATGRMAWVGMYLMMSGILCLISKIPGKRGCIWAVVMLTGIQAMDMKHEMIVRHNQQAVSKTTYTTKLADPKWDKLGKESDTIVFSVLPPDYLAQTALFFTFAEYADEYDMELSSFAVARLPYQEMRAYADEQLEAFVSGQGDTQTIYVFFHPEDAPADNEFIDVYTLDGYTIAVSEHTL